MTSHTYIYTPTITHSLRFSCVVSTGFNQLMLHTDTNEDNLTAFLKLLDNALQHEVTLKINLFIILLFNIYKAVAEIICIGSKWNHRLAL